MEKIITSSVTYFVVTKKKKKLWCCNTTICDGDRSAITYEFKVNCGAVQWTESCLHVIQSKKMVLYLSEGIIG
jgi:hypothetical protein